MRIWPFGGTVEPSRRRTDQLEVKDVPPDRSRWWLPGVGVGVLAIVALIALPHDSSQWDFVFLCASLLSFVILFGAALAMPRGVRGIWWSLFAFQALTIAAQALLDRETDSPGTTIEFPSAADAVSLAAYVPVFVALGVLIHRLSPGRDREAWIDSSILSVAAASIFGLFLVAPVLSSPDLGEQAATVAIAYLLLDLAVLSSLIWLLVGGGRPQGSMLLLVASFAMTLTADIVRDVSLVNAEPSISLAWLDVLRVAALDHDGRGGDASDGGADRHSPPAPRRACHHTAAGRARRRRARGPHAGGHPAARGRDAESPCSSHWPRSP